MAAANFPVNSHLSLCLSDELDSRGRLGWENCDATGLGFIGSTPQILGRGGPQIPRAMRGLLPCAREVVPRWVTGLTG
jgi:hypothetical protein